MSEQRGPQPRPSPVVVERIGQAVVARLNVKVLDEADLKALARAIDQASEADPGIGRVVLDLSHVAILPSLVLGLLVQIGNQCRARQQQLKLAAAQPQIRKVFSITRLDRVFQFADGVDAALE